jgi:hypothetical protein
LLRRRQGQRFRDDPKKMGTRVERWRRLGGDLLVEAEVLFDRRDADFELEAFVEIVRHVVFDDREITRVVIENLLQPDGAKSWALGSALRSSATEPAGAKKRN